MAEKNLRLEIEQLVSSNCRLSSTVQELRLEIAYYKGEKRRVEWEKNALENELSRQTDQFKKWLLHQQALKPMIENRLANDGDFLQKIVRTPPKPIDSILDVSDDMVMLVSCDDPFSIEYCNKAWSEECLFDPHEMHGKTCKILQGAKTDKQVVSRFMQNVVTDGFAEMRVVNYKKNGAMFTGTVTAYPVFDSVPRVRGGSGAPVMTHFASVLSDVERVPDVDSMTTIAGVRKLPQSKKVCTKQREMENGNMTVSTKTSNVDRGDIHQIVHDLNSFVDQHLEDMMGMPCSSTSAEILQEKDDCETSGISMGKPEVKNEHGMRSRSISGAGRKNSQSDLPCLRLHDSGKTVCAESEGGMEDEIAGTESSSFCRKRPLSEIDTSSIGEVEIGTQKKKMNTVLSNYYKITMENLIHHVTDVRLSELLRYMVSFDVPLALTDKSFRILHVNAPWFATYGYSLAEVEGETLAVLEGELTDKATLAKHYSTASAGMMADSSSMLYAADGTSALNRVVTIPVYGGYDNMDITHYCTAFEVFEMHQEGPVQKMNSSNDFSA
jgi:PAS domain-containing protein